MPRIIARLCRQQTATKNSSGAAQRLVGLGASRRPFGDGLLPGVPRHHQGAPEMLSFCRASKSERLKPDNQAKTKFNSTLQAITYSTFARPKPSTFARPPTSHYARLPGHIAALKRWNFPRCAISA